MAGLGYGIERPEPHVDKTHVPSAKYLVEIESGGTAVAKLFLADRSEVAEFDAGSEEIASMLSGLTSQSSATDKEWDRALAGNSAAERSEAKVYVLEP